MEIDYPIGWKPPFVQRAMDRIKLSRKTYPIGRYAKQEPIDVSVPITFKTLSDSRDRLESLIGRMQGEPFLYQWNIHDPDHTMWAWLDSHSGFNMTDGGLVDITLNLRGYVDYDDVPISI